MKVVSVAGNEVVVLLSRTEVVRLVGTDRIMSGAEIEIPNGWNVPAKARDAWDAVQRARWGLEQALKNMEEIQKGLESRLMGARDPVDAEARAG